MYWPPDVHNDSHAEHSVHKLPPRVGDGSGKDSAALRESMPAFAQPEGSESKATMPHVLAWLEQGRGLFDSDDSDDSERPSVQSQT